MNQSRISQLLSQSRSRHEYIRSPELKKLSRQWLAQKRRSQESNGDLRKMMSEMRYLESLNSKLNKGIFKKGKILRAAQQARERYNQDIRKKHELHQQRIQEMLKNRELANRIRQDRLNKIRAVKQSFFDKQSMGNYYRSEGRKLKEMKQQNYSREYSQNRSRVQQIIQFEYNLRESAIRKKQKDNMTHMNAYRAAINKEKQNQKLNEIKSFQVKKRLKALTESSTQKLRHIADIHTDILKYKSPYALRLKRRAQGKLGCQTQKNYTERDYDSSSIYISQYHAID